MIKFVKLTLRLVVVLLACLPAGHAEKEVVDKIVAVVGDEVILASELATQVQLIAFQTQQQPRTGAELQQLQKDILDNMISEKLFLFEARKDTSIEVRPEEIEQALDDHVARISQNFETEESFLQALAEEGLTLRDLRKQYRTDVENQVMKQRLIQQRLYSVSVSRHEVEQFYEAYSDSIPDQPEGVKLAHILLQFAPSSAVEDSIQAMAEDLRKQVLDGADLATLSVRHSSFGAGANGGDLGWVAREDVVPEFARAAFNLQPGDISGVVRTQFGYHVLLCEGRDEERVKLRHILLGVTPSSEDSAMTYRVADSLMTELGGGAVFAEFAKTFSADDDTRAQGGELGWFATEQMPPEFIETVAGWKTPGEHRGPVASRFGLHILKLLEHQPEKKFTLEEDFDRIKELARQHKTDAMVTDWVDEIRARTYVDLRLED
jgi:peptidyl-prolyl cis-trans isomerase SurA